jgi:hypothetical protein
MGGAINCYSVNTPRRGGHATDFIRSSHVSRTSRGGVAPEPRLRRSRERISPAAVTGGAHRVIDRGSDSHRSPRVALADFDLNAVGDELRLGHPLPATCGSGCMGRRFVATEVRCPHRIVVISGQGAPICSASRSAATIRPAHPVWVWDTNVTHRQLRRPTRPRRVHSLRGPDNQEPTALVGFPCLYARAPNGFEPLTPSLP